MSYGCNSSYTVPVVSICDPCSTNTGCPIQLDWDCSIYHKSNSAVSSLTNLDLPNGTTLTQFAEAVDVVLGQIEVDDWDLSFLRASYTINTLQQFAESVDTELSNITSDITSLQSSISSGITATDTQSIDFTASAFNITGSLKVDPAVNNRLTVSGTGVLVSPQNLNPNYLDKTLALTGSNTVVDMASFFTITSGYLGSVSADPSGTLDGQIWYNTTTSKLRFQVSSVLIIDLN